MYSLFYINSIILTTEITLINANSKFTFETSRISDFLRSTKRTEPDDVGTARSFFKNQYRLMIPITRDAIKTFKLKNRVTAKRQQRIQNAAKTAKPVGKPEFENKFISQTNLFRTRVGHKLIQKQTKESSRNILTKFSALNRKRLRNAIKKSKSKNHETKFELVETPEFERKNTSPTNLIRTRVELQSPQTTTDKPDRKIRNKFSVLKRKFTPFRNKFSVSKRKITPSVSIYIPDVLKLNKNLGRQQGFEGSHLSHFIKSMDDGAFEAKHGENRKLKPACKGLNLYFGVFDCER